jgi:hypothetical protein
MARNIASGATGLVNFGNRAAQLGDLSVGIWVKLGAGSNTGTAIITSGATTENEVDNEYLWLAIAGASNAWDLAYLHEYDNGANQSNTFNTNLNNGVWYYVGLTRNVTAKTVDLYLGDGITISLFGTYTYTTDPTGGGGANTRFCLFRRGDGATAQLDDATLANLTFYTRTLSLGEHAMLMLGRVPQGNLLVWAPLWGSSPEVDLSGNGYKGTVTSTTVADGPPVAPPFPGTH